MENTKTRILINEIALKIKPDSVVYNDANHPKFPKKYSHERDKSINNIAIAY
jgi:hypothetical protein